MSFSLLNCEDVNILDRKKPEDVEACIENDLQNKEVKS